MTVSRGATEIAQSVIRRRNLSRMLNELHRRGPLTRSELALSLRVNRSTVASLIAELAARDLVSERYRDKPEVQPTPGRPSPVVEICRDGPAALALELSTDWIRAAVIGLGAWVAVSVRRDLPLASSTPGQALDEMHEIVAPMLKGLVRGPRVVAIGLSVPGAVRAQDGHVYDAPNLGWHDVPLGSLVRRRFHELGVSVFVGNDADLATSAEQLRGSGHGAADSSVYGARAARSPSCAGLGEIHWAAPAPWPIFYRQPIGATRSPSQRCPNRADGSASDWRVL